MYIWCTYSVFSREISHVQCVYRVLANPNISCSSFLTFLSASCFAFTGRGWHQLLLHTGAQPRWKAFPGESNAPARFLFACCRGRLIKAGRRRQCVISN